MDHLVEQKCPACEAPMHFDPKLGKLVCDYCGTTMEIPEKPREQEPEEPHELTEEELLREEETTLELDFDAISSHALDENAASFPIYNCVSCGAEVIAPAEQIALTCPYCGNNIVLTEKVSGKLRPEGVIPFRISSDELPKTMQDFYKGKALLPKGFFSESRMGKVTGVYVPFWIFGGKLDGELLYNASTSSTHRSGDYLVTTTRHYRLRRDVSMEFKDLPVDASGKVDDALMDSLEPFDMSQVRPFDMQYLAGFTADRFDRARGDVEERAKTRMMNSAKAICSAEAGRDYGSVSPVGGDLRASLTAKYMLLPVYLFHLQHAGKEYSFAVNGQSGKTVGTLPIDRGISWGYFLRRAGLILLAALAIALVKYLIGR